MQAVKWVVCCVVVMITAVGCDRSSDGPRREKEPHENGGKDDNKPVVPPGGGERPGPSDKDYDFTAELTDGVVRYDGRGVTLRFDRAGILVKSHADGARELIDLDSQSRVRFVAGPMEADSLFKGARLTVNGADVTLGSVRMKKQTAEAVWYHAVDSDGKNHILVMP